MSRAMQSLQQLLSSLPPVHLEREALTYEEAYSESPVSVYDTHDQSLNTPGWGEIDFVQKTVLNKIQALKLCIEDIQLQIGQRAQLESEILKDVGKQILSVRNEKLKMDAFFQQNIPRPNGIEVHLNQQEHILISRTQDIRSQSFRDTMELKKELRQRFLEYTEAKNLMLGFEGLM